MAAASAAEHPLVKPAERLIRNHRRLGPDVIVVNDSDLEDLRNGLDRAYNEAPPEAEQG